jgi:MYXO-CTERM domain-containing protein
MIGHELGHSLGLPDCSACDADNLEAAGDLRDVPQTVNDIYPNGAGYDQLTAAQIETADSSAFLFPSNQVDTPEPGTLLLAVSGVLGLWLRARRAKAL